MKPRFNWQESKQSIRDSKKRHPYWGEDFDHKKCIVCYSERLGGIIRNIHGRYQLYFCSPACYHKWAGYTIPKKIMNDGGNNGKKRK